MLIVGDMADCHGLRILGVIVLGDLAHVLAGLTQSNLTVASMEDHLELQTEQHLNPTHLFQDRIFWRHTPYAMNVDGGHRVKIDDKLRLS